jgi:hypothetical protein
MMYVRKRDTTVDEVREMMEKKLGKEENMRSMVSYITGEGARGSTDEIQIQGKRDRSQGK